MFKRLLKHHLKSTWIGFVSSFAFIILLGLLLALSIKSENETLFTIFIIIFVLSLYATTISLVVYQFRLFYSTTYGKQAYLTFTLPISTHALIISKIIAGLIYSIGYVISIILAILMFVLVVDPVLLNELFPVINDIIVGFELPTGVEVLISIYSIIAILAGYITIQFVMALANTTPSSKSKIGIIILLLWACSVTFSMVLVFDPLQLTFALNLTTEKVELINSVVANESGNYESLLTLWALIFEAAKLFGLYFLTVHIINKKIEIQ